MLIYMISGFDVFVYVIDFWCICLYGLVVLVY